MDWWGVTGKELGLGLENKPDVSATQQSPDGSTPPRAELQSSPRAGGRYGGTVMFQRSPRATAWVTASTGAGIDHHDA